MNLFLRATAALLTLWAPTAQAQVLTRLSSTSIPNGGVVIAASATRAYAFTQRTPLTFYVYDVSTPTAPVLLNSNTFRGATVPTGCVLVGNTLYSTSQPSTTTPATTDLLAFDVSTPTARYLRTVTLPGDNILLAASGSLLCALAVSAASPTANLLLFNNGLTQVSTTTLPGSPIGLTAGSQTAYVQYASSPAFIPVDLTTPAAPVVRPSRPGSMGAVNGQLGYGLQDPTQSSTATSPDNTLTVYDLSAPLAPRALSSTTGQIGRTLVAGTNCVFTLKTVPTYSPIDPSRFPLRAYSASISAPTPLASNAIDIPYYTSNIAAVGATAYVIDGVSMSIYALGSTVTAAKAPALAPGFAPYPNPAHGTLTLPQQPAATPITISDALGRVCLSTPLPASGTLDISPLPAGLYHVRIGSSVSKLTVE